jgi:hypothetical protein
MNLIYLCRKIFIEYIIEMNKILDVVEILKQNITDNQYKTIMESSLRERNKIYNDSIPLLKGNQELD